MATAQSPAHFPSLFSFLLLCVQDEVIHNQQIILSQVNTFFSQITTTSNVENPSAKGLKSLLLTAIIITNPLPQKWLDCKFLNKINFSGKNLSDCLLKTKASRMKRPNQVSYLTYFYSNSEKLIEIRLLSQIMLPGNLINMFGEQNHGKAISIIEVYISTQCLIRDVFLMTNVKQLMLLTLTEPK